MKNLILLFALLLILNLSATIINIPADQPTIQEGISASVHGDTVLVQPGTYIENINYNSKNITIASLFLTTQDTSYISQTIIDGNNSNHVVEFSSEEDSTAILSGFTITNGFAFRGGGIYCVGSSPKLENLIITDNIISGEWMHYGGGIYMDESSPMLKNLRIKNNKTGGTSRSYGGGIYCLESTPSLNNVLIEDNEVFSYQWAYGGGIACDDDSYIYLNNVTIKNNTVWNGTWNYGGGLYITRSSAELYNVVVTDNSIWGGSFNDGAGIHCDSSSLDMYNSIIVNNNVVDGTMYETGGFYSRFYSQLNVLNCILWNNLPLNIHCLSDTTIIVNYSNIQGGWNGEGNIDETPLFVGSGDHPFMLQDDSPCVNYGIQDTTGLNIPALDLAGNPRIFGGRIDMGAYENQNVVVGTDENLIPIITKLKQNRPNPFNPSTTIGFSIQNNSNIEITIQNIKGQKVKTLVQNQYTKGSHSIIWSGDDEFGKPVSSGVYLYKLNVDGKSKAVKKCLLLK
jgi:hypothetical protein